MKQLVLQDSGFGRLSTFIFTLFSLLAFAGNSIICRLALKGEEIDPWSFTGLRLISGALILGLLYAFRQVFNGGNNLSGERSGTRNGAARYGGALALCLYMLCFSLAYRSLSTGTGALILFGVVQLTLMLISRFRGNVPNLKEWIGTAIALIGLLVLVKPVLSTPSIYDFLLMSLAGVAWAVYTFLGGDSRDSLADTMGNFMLALPFLLLLSLPLVFLDTHELVISSRGLFFALLSGGLTSGLAYVLWYKVLPHIRPSHAAVVQLMVPAFAALGGVIFVAEPLTPVLIFATIVILGGIALSVFSQS